VTKEERRKKKEERRKKKEERRKKKEERRKKKEERRKIGKNNMYVFHFTNTFFYKIFLQK